MSLSSYPGLSLPAGVNSPLPPTTTPPTPQARLVLSGEENHIDIPVLAVQNGMQIDLVVNFVFDDDLFSGETILGTGDSAIRLSRLINRRLQLTYRSSTGTRPLVRTVGETGGGIDYPIRISVDGSGIPTLEALGETVSGPLPIGGANPSFEYNVIGAIESGGESNLLNGSISNFTVVGNGDERNYPINEGSGSTIIDSVQGKNGTIVGETNWVLP